MRILAGEAASTILLCSSSLGTKEIIFKTIPSFLGCHLFVCTEDFSVTLWSLVFVFNLCAPNHSRNWKEGGFRFKCKAGDVVIVPFYVCWTLVKGHGLGSLFPFSL